MNMHVLSELLDKHALLKTKCLTIQPDVPCMDDNFFSARKERHWLERRWRFSRLTVDREIFTKQREQVKRMLHTARSTFYVNTIQDQAGNSKALFQTVGSLLHMKHLTTTTLDNYLIVSETISLTKLPV